MRLGDSSSIEARGVLFYGGRQTHRRDGTPLAEGIVWEYSVALSSTHDWTPLAVEFVVRHHGSTLILEQTGPGQAWFDNVVIEDLGREPSR